MFMRLHPEATPQLKVTIPFAFLNADWARNVHSQSLERLDERGGMTWTELWCNMERTYPHTLAQGSGDVLEKYCFEQVMSRVFNEACVSHVRLLTLKHIIMGSPKP